MFGHQFYPTPIPVIEKMLEPYKGKYHKGGINGYMEDGYKLHNKLILEPSAGKGDILDYITGNAVLGINKEYSRSDYDHEIKSKESAYKRDCYCFELDINLQTLLEDKSYNFLGNDFLAFNNLQQYWFDLILMNPPFDRGATHFLHAWHILKTGDIVCLLNEETILNPFTEERKLLCNIIEDNGGTVEYLGNCFGDSENTTNVRVALVRISKVTKSDFDFDFKTKEFEEFKLEDEEFINALKKPDFIADMQSRYTEVLDSYKKAYKAIKELKHHMSIVSSEHYKLEFESPISEFRDLSKFINSKLWFTVIDKLNMDKYMTHSVRENFSKYITQKGLLEFNQENIQDLIAMLFENQFTILENAVVDVFDLFTQYHSENRCHVEGWKTNSAWKVNRKIILPHWIQYGQYMNSHDLKQHGDKLKINWNYQSKFSDIDKVMCYLTGIDYQKFYGSLYKTLEHKLKAIGNIKTGNKFDSSFESYFFDCKIFRKGTLHITFKDEKLWQEFNMRACAGKNWLPPAEKKAWEDSKKKPEPKQEAPITPVIPQLPMAEKKVFSNLLF